jgi:neutral ceramidase
MRVGRGIADITGEPADCGMLGYGKSEQRTAGIHLRLRARAFAFDDGERRVLLVVAELPLPMQSVTDEVLSRLAATHGALYTDANTVITTTHTHAGPGGYCGHLLYNLTTKGFHPATFEAIVTGIVEAVTIADADLTASDVTFAHGELRDASTNRAATAFARNPAADRAVFPDAIDPQTSLVGIRRGGELVGAINFFATHGTSMTNHNLLISGDNKGYAAFHAERLEAGGDYLAGQPDFIAAFAQTNAGDMSPNVERTNIDAKHSVGPTTDDVENTRIIGRRQYDAAAGLFEAGTPIGDTVDSRLIYVDLGDVEVRPEFTPDGRPHRTSSPIAAAAQIAGTIDGDGFAGFNEGHNNRLVDGISSLLYRLNPRFAGAQAPKGAVISLGRLNRLTPFVQERVPVQLIRIGRLYLLTMPGEVTIVSGLRLRRTVAEIVGAELADVLCVGYSNAYIHYVTTPEEYEEQRYEGGSTIFGRWQLPALMQVASGLATAMRDGTPVASGTSPGGPNRMSWVRTAQPDAGQFGTVITPPSTSYEPGRTVHVAFASANPNHDLHRGRTNVEVQRRDGDDWTRVADDGDWSTTFGWRRETQRRSVATVTWTIPDDAAGEFRVVHHGCARRVDGTLTAFTGESPSFTVS